MENKEIKSQELFDKWFVSPLSKLESIPNGDGGFIALATSCFLYERYAKACIDKSGNKADETSLMKHFAYDFDTDKKTAEAFWDVIRNGILHQGMPKQRSHGRSTLPGYIFHHSFTIPVELVEWNGQPTLKIQPWVFMWKVIELCQNNSELLIENKNFPFPSVL